MCVVNEAYLPQRSTWRSIDVCVEGVQALVLRCYEHDIALYAVNGQVCRPQRLGVNRPIHRAREELAESGARHVGRRESVFLRIAAVTGEVVVIGEDAGEVGDAKGYIGALGYVAYACGCQRVDSSGGGRGVGGRGARCCRSKRERATRRIPGYSLVQRIVANRRRNGECLADGQATGLWRYIHTDARLGERAEGREQKQSQRKEKTLGQAVARKLINSFFAEGRLEFWKRQHHQMLLVCSHTFIPKHLKG